MEKQATTRNLTRIIHCLLEGEATKHQIRNYCLTDWERVCDGLLWLQNHGLVKKVLKDSRDYYILTEEGKKWTNRNQEDQKSPGI